MASNEQLSFLNNSSSSPMSMSDSFLSESLASGSEGFLDSAASDAEFGFSRPEFRQKPLAGTVHLYSRHVFLCYKNPQVWPPRIEAAEFDRLPRLLSAALLSRKPHMPKETSLTICEGHDGTETSNGDVLIFPDMIRYRRLTHFDVDTFVEEVLVKDGEWLPGTPERLKGTYVFVCSHGSRDRRCGVCGPPLVSRFRELIESCGLQGKVSVSPCSHIGGHKYAGNVIIFGSNINGEIAGHWYGYVSPDDVQILLEQHIVKGEIVDWLWRGQMGLSEEEQKRAQERRLQLNGESSQTQTSETQSGEFGSQVEVMGCCQGNGASLGCCQENGIHSCTAQDMMENPGVDGMTKKKSAEKKSSSKKLVSRMSSSSRRVCSMPTWFESWEREDTYAVVAVACAAVSVGIAYSCYKHL